MQTYRLFASLIIVSTLFLLFKTFTFPTRVVSTHHEEKQKYKRFEADFNLTGYIRSNIEPKETYKVLLSEEDSERRKRFVDVYEKRLWVVNNDVPVSGVGSTPENTRITKQSLKAVLLGYGIKSMLDAPCGDLAWMSELFPFFDAAEIKYIGVDIVPSLIESAKQKHPEREFRVVDFVSDSLPKVDLIFNREALQHLAPGDVIRALDNFSNSGAKYLLTTEFVNSGVRNDKKTSIETKSFQKYDLMRYPFHLIHPLAMFSDPAEMNANNPNPHLKFLALWELPLKYRITHQFMGNLESKREL